MGPASPTTISRIWVAARNLVERFFNKIKQCRRVATRYDKHSANYPTFIKLASIRIWLRANESTPQVAPYPAVVTTVSVCSTSGGAAKYCPTRPRQAPKSSEPRKSTV
jgi:hypothetical protein